MGALGLGASIRRVPPSFAPGPRIARGPCMVDRSRRLARPIQQVRRASRWVPAATGRWSRRRVPWFSAMIPTSPVRSDGPGRAHRQRTLPARRPDHQPPLAPTSTGHAERNKRVAAQARTACGAPESTKYQNSHDVPFRDRDVRRSRKFHASAPPTCPFPVSREYVAALLPHQRLRELPRGRCGPRRRDLPGLRLHPPSALTPKARHSRRQRATVQRATVRKRATVRSPAKPRSVPDTHLRSLRQVVPSRPALSRHQQRRAAHE